jgi:NADPH:quinone reductase-like Zn-dependent oxidoreductase
MYLTNYGPTGLTSYLSIKKEIMPFEIFNAAIKRIKTKEELCIVITSAAGGVGLTVTQYLSKLGYRNVYGIVGTD